MTEAASVFNVGGTLDFEGHRYRVRAMTLEDEAKFSAWLEGEAYAAHERNRRRMSDEAYFEGIERLGAASATGKYDWQGKRSLESITTPSGLKMLLSLVLTPEKADAPAVNDEMIDRLFAAKVQETMALLERAHADPKAREALKAKRKAQRQARRDARARGS